MSAELKPGTCQDGPEERVPGDNVVLGFGAVLILSLIIGIGLSRLHHFSDIRSERTTEISETVPLPYLAPGEQCGVPAADAMTGDDETMRRILDMSGVRFCQFPDPDGTVACLVSFGEETLHTCQLLKVKP